jgi:hypothetical protein
LHVCQPAGALGWLTVFKSKKLATFVASDLLVSGVLLHT